MIYRRYEIEKLDINSFTKEQIARASLCKTTEELVELARKYDIEITKEQAKAYLDELQDAELTPEALEKIAGGWKKNAESILLQTIIKKY